MDNEFDRLEDTLMTREEKIERILGKDIYRDSQKVANAKDIMSKRKILAEARDHLTRHIEEMS